MKLGLFEQKSTTSKDESSLTIGVTRFDTHDAQSIAQAVAMIKNLPVLPISNKTITNPQEAVTILQRENCFVVDEPQVKYLATVECMDCLFIVFIGKTEDGKAAYLSSHVDNTKRFIWEKRLETMKNHPIEVYLVGGEEGSQSSEAELSYIVRYLMMASKVRKLNIIFKQQRIMQHFRQTKAEIPEQCYRYIFYKADVIYHMLFKKSVPNELYSLDFGLTDPATYRSKMPGLEKALDDVHNMGEAMPSHLISQFRSQLFKLTEFCLFLSSVGSDDIHQQLFFKIKSGVYAPDEDTFIKNLRTLFSPEGYDAIRLLLFCRGHNAWKYKYCQFALSLEPGNMTVFPISSQFHKIEHRFPRHGQVINLEPETEYFESYNSKDGYKKPLFSQDFIDLCEKATRRGIDLSVFNPQLGSSERIQLCVFLSYYPEHRADFAEQPASSKPL